MKSLHWKVAYALLAIAAFVLASGAPGSWGGG